MGKHIKHFLKKLENLSNGEYKQKDGNSKVSKGNDRNQNHYNINEEFLQQAYWWTLIN